MYIYVCVCVCVCVSVSVFLFTLTPIFFVEISFVLHPMGYGAAKATGLGFVLLCVVSQQSLFGLFLFNKFP